MNTTIPMILWGLTCLFAAVGSIWIFRSEQKQDHRTIQQLSRTIRLQRDLLATERERSRRLRARLSQLQPVPEDMPLLNDKADTVYDQTKDRGLTRRIRTW